MTARKQDGFICANSPACVTSSRWAFLVRRRSQAMTRSPALPNWPRRSRPSRPGTPSRPRHRTHPAEAKFRRGTRDRLHLPPDKGSFLSPSRRLSPTPSPRRQRHPCRPNPRAKPLPRTSRLLAFRPITPAWPGLGPSSGRSHSNNAWRWSGDAMPRSRACPESGSSDTPAPSTPHCRPCRPASRSGEQPFEIRPAWPGRNRSAGIEEAGGCRDAWLVRPPNPCW